MHLNTLQKIRKCLLSDRASQFGGGLLPVVATAGVIMVMAQGTVYYKAKTGAKFLTTERNKVMAQQVAEAGIENGIADLGSRRIVVTEGMREQVTAQGVAVGNGTFTTTLTTVARGPQSDTVDFNSTGQVSGNTKSVAARLKLTMFIDSTPQIVSRTNSTVQTKIDTNIVYTTTTTTTIQDPNAMPDLNTTAAYTACMSGSPKKCDVCHLPSGDISKANVINIAKSAINTHISHHGDYVTTDGTCDVYKPKTVSVVTSHLEFNTRLDTVVTIVMDTTIRADTLTKVKVLSWR